MAIPKPEPRDWQIANAQELQATDREVLALLRASKKRVDELLAALPKGKQEIRRSQLEQSRAALLAEQATLFERLGDLVSARRARAASRSARLSAAADAALLSLVGKGPQGQFLYETASQVSQRAIDAALARMRFSAVPLSERIYRTGVWMGGRLGKLINETLASGLNATEFAKRARDWFNPNTPGGVRYAAMRLARTEINNAFHSMSAQKYAETPWINEVEWNLSKSHPKPDICNKVAADSPFPSDKVPARPHPQCMCYITPKSVDEDEFIDRFLDGEYDDFLDAELARNGWEDKAETPQPVTPVATQITTPEPETRVPVAPLQDAELAGFVERLVQFEGDGRDAVVAELNVQAELTPKAIRRLTGVTKMSAAEEKALKARFGKDAIGGYTSESRSIAISREVFTDGYDRQFAKEVKNGFLSNCPHGHKHDGLHSFVAHEYGHHVEEVIRFAGNSAMRPVWRAVGEALGIKPPSLYDKESVNRWVAKNRPLIAKKVSKYGSETGGELLAEVWAEYSRDPNPRPHIKAIGDAIKMASEGPEPATQPVKLPPTPPVASRPSTQTNLPGSGLPGTNLPGSGTPDGPEFTDSQWDQIFKRMDELKANPQPPVKKPRVKPADRPDTAKLPGYGRVEAPAEETENVRALGERISDKIGKRIQAKIKRVASIHETHVGDEIRRISSVQSGIPKDSGFNAQNTFAVAFYDSGNVHFHSGFEKKADVLVGCHHSHHFVHGGDDAHENTIAHEFGHVFISKNRLSDDQIHLILHGIKKALDLPRGPKPGRRFDDRTTALLALDNLFAVEENKAVIQAKVSGYATTNVNEFMAEIWADYTMNPNSAPYIKEIGDLMKSIVNGEQGGKLSAVGY